MLKLDCTPASYLSREYQSDVHVVHLPAIQIPKSRKRTRLMFCYAGVNPSPVPYTPTLSRGTARGSLSNNHGKERQIITHPALKAADSVLRQHVVKTSVGATLSATLTTKRIQEMNAQHTNTTYV
jgi:hypothetical protein